MNQPSSSTQTPPRPPLIALTGMMLSGKSTIGAALAKHYGIPFRDLDEAIARAAGKSIPQIFADDGERAFRVWERRTLVRLVQNLPQNLPKNPTDRSAAETGNPRLILALGGGAFESREVRRWCLQRGFVVYLEADAEVLVARYRAGGGRPLLDDALDPRQVLSDLIERRHPNYARAHCTLPVAKSDVNTLVARIVDEYRNFDSS